MTLALKSLRFMLIAAALSTALMLILWIALGNPAAQSATFVNGFNLVACTLFTFLLPKRQTWVNVAFLIFCFILLVGSKGGGFTLTTFPSYIMTLLSFGGIAGIVQAFNAKRNTQ